MAVRAAAAIGLDVAGVDFLTDDISQSHKEFGGAICEVNAAPGFRMHAYPSEGRPRDVAGAVMDMLFPPGTPKRACPIFAVTGTNGKTTTVRMLAHIHKLAGSRVGLATTDGVYLDGQLTVPGDMTGPASARIVLRDPAVEVAVLETARGGILRGRPRLPARRRERLPERGGRPSRPAGREHPRGAGRGEAGRHRRGQRHGGAERRRSARAADGRLRRGRARVLRDHEPTPRAGARAHPGRRPRRRAGGGHRGPHDHDLRQRPPHPARCGRT